MDEQGSYDSLFGRLNPLLLQFIVVREA